MTFCISQVLCTSQPRKISSDSCTIPQGCPKTNPAQVTPHEKDLETLSFPENAAERSKKRSSVEIAGGESFKLLVQIRRFHALCLCTRVRVAQSKSSTTDVHCTSLHAHRGDEDVSEDPLLSQFASNEVCAGDPAQCDTSHESIYAEEHCYPSRQHYGVDVSAANAGAATSPVAGTHCSVRVCRRNEASHWNALLSRHPT